MFHDRNHAANLLAEKLIEYKDKDAVVVAIPRGGVLVGQPLAKALGLPLDIIPSKRIKDPAHPDESIGSVSSAGLDITTTNQEIPQDYIYHQVSILQHLLKHQYEKYVGSKKPPVLTNRTIILVDDKINSASQFLACFRSLGKHKPAKIIAAIPVLTENALQRLKAEPCEVIYLETTCHSNVEEHYELLPKVAEQEIIQLLDNSNLLTKAL